MLVYLTITLVVLNIILIYLVAKLWKREKDIRKDAIGKSRGILEGKFKEQLVPFLPKFNYTPSDVRFLGSPIDFVVFDGASKNKINKIVFLEIKSGKSRLTEKEKQIKDLVNNKKIKFNVLRI